MDSIEIFNHLLYSKTFPYADFKMNYLYVCLDINLFRLFDA